MAPRQGASGASSVTFLAEIHTTEGIPKRGCRRTGGGKKLSGGAFLPANRPFLAGLTCRLAWEVGWKCLIQLEKMEMTHSPCRLSCPLGRLPETPVSPHPPEQLHEIGGKPPAVTQGRGRHSFAQPRPEGGQSGQVGR